LTCPARARTSRYSVHALSPWNTSVGGSRPRRPAYAGVELSGRKGRASRRHRSGLKIPPRPLPSPATSREYAGARPLLWWPASLTEERGVPIPSMLFPPSVFPLWKPPFLIPPFNWNTPKGANRGGQQHGVFTGAAEETAGPLSPRGAAPRRPSG